MSNMSYCRFQNTSGDLYDCVDALESLDLPDSREEVNAAKRMRELCERFIEAFDDADLDILEPCKGCHDVMTEHGGLCDDCDEAAREAIAEREAEDAANAS